MWLLAHTCLDLRRIEVTQAHIEQLANDIGVVRCRKDPRLDPVVPIEWGVGMTTYGVFDPQAIRVARGIQDRIRQRAASLPRPSFAEVWVRDNRCMAEAGSDGRPTDSVPLGLVSWLVARYLRSDDERCVQDVAREGGHGFELDALFPSVPGA